ncbi:hypothetical protein [Streptomyces malaysiensis]|uniref:Flavin-dependent monooxygenase, reductase subunit n=1 Tax=Streptomyces malaysiensis TaxID=92644 RepID=A0A7X6B1D0_STRMQ|nr:hypothetical protein [Streptomyces malaysiensis]NIY69441.1 Flavin-dependent monooxygenase, reductase subunit [Streptomyces malaysiensis]
MIVRVTGTDVVIEGGDDLTRLHVATALAPDAATQVLCRARVGRLADDGTVLLDLEALRVRASEWDVPDGWGARWQAMIDFAGRKGWLSADGRSVQAHVEWEG